MLNTLKLANGVVELWFLQRHCCFRRKLLEEYEQLELEYKQLEITVNEMYKIGNNQEAERLLQHMAHRIPILEDYANAIAKTDISLKEKKK